MTSARGICFIGFVRRADAPFEQTLQLMVAFYPWFPPSAGVGESAEECGEHRRRSRRLSRRLITELLDPSRRWQ